MLSLESTKERTLLIPLRRVGSSKPAGCIKVRVSFEAWNAGRANLGRNVEVLVKGGEKLKGKLLNASEEEIEIEIEEKRKIEGKKKKELVKEQITLPMEQINETKVVISFK